MAIAAGSVSTLADVVAAFRRARSITAICHQNPDADTVASAVAVLLIAERLGAEAEIVSADGIPPSFAFLPRVEFASRWPRLDPGLAVICDAATLERVGPIAHDPSGWLERATVVNIDHHTTSDYFGDLNLVDPTAAATCEVIARLAQALGIGLDGDLASALLAGIVRDSHGFSTESTTAETLRTAAQLVDAGAPLARIHRLVISELPYSTVALWGLMLGRMQQASGGRIIYATLTADMLEATGTAQHDADGLAEFMAATRGVEIALLLRDLAGPQTRVSIRTVGSVDAARLAGEFGGGGHVRRAGCTLELPSDQALVSVLAACEKALG